jgi:hypothetical protein
MLFILLRSLVLAIIVFGSITFIPSTSIAIHNRVIITGVVVLVYNLIDYVGLGLLKLRKLLCKLFCECNESKQDNKIELDAKIDTSEITDELNTNALSEAIDKALHEESTATTLNSSEAEERACIASGLKAEGIVPAETQEGFSNYGLF